MRIRVIRHTFNPCFRIFSHRQTNLWQLILFIFILFICFFLLIKIKTISCLSSHQSNTIPSNDIVDTCMLDDSPCYPDIDKSLNRYFNKIKRKYSMLLTYHPQIDCEHGRYLLLDQSLSYRTHHGTGSQLMWYVGVLNIAYALNLTVIHFPWTAEHTIDESNMDREKYWQFFDWQIPYSAYQLCPNNSAIKRNIFKYDLIANQTFKRYHQGKQTYTLMTHFKDLFENFLKNLKDNSTGFTFYSSRTMTITSSLMEIGVVFETRWWLQHRKLYNPQYGVWSGLSNVAHYVPIDYFPYISKANSNIKSVQCPSIDIHNTLLIGVHIRHGDVVKRNHQGKIISTDLDRYISSSAYAPLLATIIKSLPNEMKNNYLVTIYSQGVIYDFLDILIHLKHFLPQTRCHLSFLLNGRTSETFNRLVRDDIIINAHSTFSMASGIFNSRQLKIGPAHNNARVHGMRNHLSLRLNTNHTLFYITQEKVQLIKQRIRYVWQQKQKQRVTPIPLWLENYSQDYPEEFMLI